MKYTTLEDIEIAKEMISPPGDTLAETIDFKGISQSDLATRMGRPLKTINEIIKGKAAIMPETAIQLERVLGIEAAFWLERERLYRLELAEIEEAIQMLANITWIENFPLNAMKKFGWVNFENNVLSKTDAVYSFFGVSGIDPYYNYYHKSVYQQAYRMSTSSNKDPYAVSAWLKRGEHQAEKINASVYNATNFKLALDEIKKVMVKQSANFFSHLQAICLSVGVKVVHTPCLPNTKLHGSTRWLNETPLIQLSNLYNRNDIFWFTFFHEAGHIIKHGKREIFVEGLKYSPEEEIKENEANEFAAKYMLTKEQEQIVLQHLPITKPNLLQLAKQFNTHPAAIMGRLSHMDNKYNALGYVFQVFHPIDLSIF